MRTDGQQRELIGRPRIHAELARTRLVLLEAPGGYGKSVAVAEFAAALDLTVVRAQLSERIDLAGFLALLATGSRRAGLPALASLIDPGEPGTTATALIDRLGSLESRLLMAVDDIQHAAPDAAQWLADVARELPEGVRMVISGRRLAPQIAALRHLPGASYLGADALRFTTAEIAAVLEAPGTRPLEPATEDDVRAVEERTDGWPAAVALLATRGFVRAERETGLRSQVLRRLVDALLAAADSDTQELIGQLAGLPLLSPEVATIVGGYAAADRLEDAGLPLRHRADGWDEIADAIRELLPRRPLSPENARLVAAEYAGRGELAEGVALLHRLADGRGVVALLADQRRAQLIAAGLEMLDAVLTSVADDLLADAPDLIVELVHAAERRARLRAAWVQRATQVLAADSRAGRSVAVERALDAARAGDLDAGAAEAAALLGETPSGEHATIGRAHLVRGLCLLVRDTAGNLRVAQEDFEQAVGHFRAAGERDWEAEAHQALGYGCHLSAGAFAAGAEELGIALSLRPAADSARAGTLTYFAEALSLLGRTEEAAVAVREAAAIGRRLGDDRAIAYAAWTLADVACQRRDRVAVSAALEEAEAHPAGWFDQLGGTEFLAHAAEMHTLLGDRAAAARYLARAIERSNGSERAEQALAAQARFEITFGDPGEGLRLLDALAASPIAVRRDRWLALLLRAVCEAKLGRPEAAATSLELARLAAADLGDPDRLARREPELLALATPAELPPAPRSAATVILLGRFAVERDGVDVTPPPGLPSRLVKLLALRGALTVDAAIEELWDDEPDPEIGTGRVRNLVHRLRSASGPIVERRDGALVLESGASVDAQRFEQEAAAALAAEPLERPGLARRALAWSTGELLPADRYEDWADAPRERIRRRQLALLDIVASDAMARGDLDEAGRLLDEAITVDPLEEERYVRLAEVLIAQGRTRRARQVLDQAMAVATELDVPPGDELRAIRATVRASRGNQDGIAQ